MTNISLLEMGKVKKRGVREAIIEILSREFPLSIRKIYNSIRKEYHFSVTYQAVFKAIKEMLEDNLIEKEGMEYKININWINRLENEIDIIKKNYLGDSNDSEDFVKNRTNKFVSSLGPKIKKYLDKDPACIIGISGGGKIFAMALWKYLLREGIDVNYSELNWIDQESEKNLLINKKAVKNRKAILVDSEIYSGKTYEVVMAKVGKFKKKLRIKDVKYVADKDIPGLADFSRIRG